ncbi:MAG: hypothetical protein AVDCRST_MAG59-2828 [uncultured Thermomicrobiales bacterium]|uniref:Uncharacterized protein n=1 Tax=uncultured Thermomicrobiales bacterium TaxID=1645740 RepID=A0A6J4UYB6_9BACT|nr:MAG: hypothetical protein AVDCRST_MAG59-2828 [uncultured Thermomicrobiales bacterium]
MIPMVYELAVIRNDDAHRRAEWERQLDQTQAESLPRARATAWASATSAAATRWLPSWLPALRPASATGR